jgi:hypothetical protein
LQAKIPDILVNDDHVAQSEQPLIRAGTGAGNMLFARVKTARPELAVRLDVDCSREQRPSGFEREPFGKTQGKHPWVTYAVDGARNAMGRRRGHVDIHSGTGLAGRECYC